MSDRTKYQEVEAAYRGELLQNKVRHRTNHNSAAVPWAGTRRRNMENAAVENNQQTHLCTHGRLVLKGRSEVLQLVQPAVACVDERERDGKHLQAMARQRQCSTVSIHSGSGKCTD